jgi:hypothetical protein
VVAGIVGLETDEVRKVLVNLVEAKRVAEANGKYLLTPAARMALDSNYSRLYADVRVHPDFKAGYEGFERLNGALKQLITDWQTLPVGGGRVPNDHGNKDYDAKIIDRLAELHERAELVLKRLARVVPRFQIYDEKLRAALGRSEDGAIQWVSDAKIESYHSLWFELHEDLLRLMGREREE